jgi:hypothetical protein
VASIPVAFRQHSEKFTLQVSKYIEISNLISPLTPGCPALFSHFRPKHCALRPTVPLFRFPGLMGGRENTAPTNPTDKGGEDDPKCHVDSHVVLHGRPAVLILNFAARLCDWMSQHRRARMRQNE